MIPIASSAPPAGGYLTPHEFNAEMRRIVAASTALAADNIGSQALGAGPFQLNSYGHALEFERTTNQDTTIPAQDMYGEFQFIPNDAGDPWIESFETADGYLEGTFGITMQSVGGTPVASILWIGLLVDGELVTQGPLGDYTSVQDSATCEFAIPIRAGSHRIEAVYGYHAAPSVAQTIQWNEGSIVMFEMVR